MNFKLAFTNSDTRWMAAYFTFTYLFLLWLSFSNSSVTCRSQFLISAKLTVISVVWGWVSGKLAELLFFKMSEPRCEICVFTGILTCGGLFVFANWMYISFNKGVHFQGTWADMTCFFVETVGFVFPFFAAPVLALVTVAWKILTTSEYSR